jgi:hypothetical protein
MDTDKISILGVHGKFRLATGRTVRGSNPGWGEIFHIRPDCPWAPPSLLYSGYRVIPGVKLPGRGVNHLPYLRLRLKKEYYYTSTPLSDFMAGHRVKFTLLLYLYTESFRKC